MRINQATDQPVGSWILPSNGQVIQNGSHAEVRAMEYIPLPPPKTSWTVDFVDPSTGKTGEIELDAPSEGANHRSFKGEATFAYEVVNPVGNIYTIIVQLAE